MIIAKKWSVTFFNNTLEACNQYIQSKNPVVHHLLLISPDEKITKDLLSDSHTFILQDVRGVITAYWLKNNEIVKKALNLNGQEQKELLSFLKKGEKLSIGTQTEKQALFIQWIISVSRTPICFISYARGNSKHEQWAYNLKCCLEMSGVKTY